MSYHVYLARPGFAGQPIDEAHWLAVAARSPLLAVRPAGPPGSGGRDEVTLAGDPRQRLWWSSGVVVANDPTAELMAALFELAGPLEAGVYSEGRNPYASVADWRQRARRYRSRQGRDRASRLRRLRRVAGHALLWLLVVLVGLIGLRLVR